MLKFLRALVAAALFCGAADAATLLPNGQQVFLNSNGTPLAGGSVTTYVPGTTTLKSTWIDPNGVTLNTNPIILDSAGRATIYGTGSYRQVLSDALGNLIWDKLTNDTAGLGLSWGGTSVGSANAQGVTVSNFSSADGQQIAFVAGFSNTSSATLNPNATGPINIVKDTNAGSVSLSGGEIVAGNVIQVTYSTASGSFHMLSTPQSSPVPTGAVFDFAGSSAPSGYLLLAGQAVSRTTYLTLFNLIGTTYGVGDGSTTFNLPDARGRTIAGLDNMGGSAASRLTSATMSPNGTTLGAIGGNETSVLTLAQLPVVTPTGTVSVTFPGLSYLQPASPTLSYAAGGAVQATNGSTAATTGGAGPTGFSLSIASFGSGTAHPTIQPTIAMNMIIKY
jgi:microcystin-dependent protein